MVHDNKAKLKRFEFGLIAVQISLTLLPCTSVLFREKFKKINL